MNRFNKEALEVRNLDPSVAFTALLRDIRDNKLQFSLSKRPPSNLVNLHARCEKYINAAEAMAARKEAKEGRTDKKRGGQENREIRIDQAKRQCSSHRFGRSKSLTKGHESFTPLNSRRSDILMEIRNEEYVKWPGKLHSKLEKRDSNKYYQFHQDHGHDTDECRKLKEEIENLI